MKPQDDAITGGTVLRIAAVQSPNFAAGVSGWIVRQDGSAEFNTGTFRGSIEVGPDPGKHFIVNNSATGDVVDIYDSTNALTMKIDAQGRLVAYDTPGDQVIVSGAGIQFITAGNPAPHNPANVIGLSDSTGSSLQTDSGNSVTGFGDSFIILGDSNYLGAGGVARIKVSQRGKPAAGFNIQGELVQTDTFGTGNSAMHTDVYTVNTNANGDATFNHNCAFTPNTGFLTGLQNASHNPFYQYGWYQNPFTSTTAHVNLRNLDGTVYANVTGASLMGVFYG